MLGNKRQCVKETSAYIVFVNPQDQKMKTLEVGRNNTEFVIGRGNSSDVVVSNPVVSRKHCVIKNDENGDWILYDKSISGVFVNRERVLSGGSHTLHEGDTITLTGPFNYPFYFYTSEPCQKKKKLSVATDVLYEANNRNEGRKETNLKEERNSSVVLLSSEDDHNSSINNGVIVDDSSVVVDKDLNNENAKGVVREVCGNVEEISSLRSRLEKLMGEKVKLKEKNAKASEQHLKDVNGLKLELKVAEFRNNNKKLRGLPHPKGAVSYTPLLQKELNNETIENLKSELGEMRGSLLEKDNELKLMEAKLFVAEQSRQVKEEDVKNEVLLKVKEDMMELLENELQCSICNEIIIEAAVLNCTHLFCHLCISTWMKKKKECAVCRTQVKEVVKSRAMDSFIEKLVQKFSSPELSEHRKQVIEDRKKEIMGKSRPRQARNNRQVREAAVGGQNLIQQPYYLNMAIPQPENVVRVMDRIRAYFPEVDHLRGDIADDLNDIMGNNLLDDLPILRLNRRVRRGRRGQPVRFHGGEVVIDLRDSPERV